MPHSDMTLIFLMGRQRAGKDTVADYLVKEYGFEKLALADEVKDIAKDYFGMEEKDRGLLIQIGTKMREIDPDVWINILWRLVSLRHRFGVDRFVIPDVRFPNEYEFFQKQGGIPVRVDAPWSIRHLRPGYDEEFESDPTETQLDEYPSKITLFNWGTFDQLYYQVDKFMEYLGVDRR